MITFYVDFFMAVVFFWPFNGSLSKFVLTHISCIEIEHFKAFLEAIYFRFHRFEPYDTVFISTNFDYSRSDAFAALMSAQLAYLPVKHLSFAFHGHHDATGEIWYRTRRRQKKIEFPGVLNNYYLRYVQLFSLGLYGDGVFWSPMLNLAISRNRLLYVFKAIYIRKFTMSLLPLACEKSSGDAIFQSLLESPDSLHDLFGPDSPFKRRRIE